MKCKCKKIVGQQNQSYRSVIKTLSPKEHTWSRSKHVRRDKRFLSLGRNSFFHHFH